MQCLQVVAQWNFCFSTLLSKNIKNQAKLHRKIHIGSTIKVSFKHLEVLKFPKYSELWYHDYISLPYPINLLSGIIFNCRYTGAFFVWFVGYFFSIGHLLTDLFGEWIKNEYWGKVLSLVLFLCLWQKPVRCLVLEQGSCRKKKNRSYGCDSWILAHIVGFSPFPFTIRSLCLARHHTFPQVVTNCVFLISGVLTRDSRVWFAEVLSVHSCNWS